MSSDAVEASGGFIAPVETIYMPGGPAAVRQEKIDRMERALVEALPLPWGVSRDVAAEVADLYDPTPDRPHAAALPALTAPRGGISFATGTDVDRIIRGEKPGVRYRVREWWGNRGPVRRWRAFRSRWRERRKRWRDACAVLRGRKQALSDAEIDDLSGWWEEWRCPRR